MVFPSFWYFVHRKTGIVYECYVCIWFIKCLIKRFRIHTESWIYQKFTLNSVYESSFYSTLVCMKILSRNESGMTQPKKIFWYRFIVTQFSNRLQPLSLFLISNVFDFSVGDPPTDFFPHWYRSIHDSKFSTFMNDCLRNKCWLKI